MAVSRGEGVAGGLQDFTGERLSRLRRAEGLGGGGCRMGGTDGKGEQVIPVDSTAAPAPSAKAFFPLLQLLLEPCFSPVAQMRPWWSPVSILRFLDPQTPASLASAFTHLLTSSAVLISSSTNSWLQACDFQTLPLSGPGCFPSNSQILVGIDPPFFSQFYSLPYSKALPPPPQLTGPFIFQVSAGAPQSWWLGVECLSCLASSRFRGGQEESQGRGP